MKIWGLCNPFFFQQNVKILLEMFFDSIIVQHFLHCNEVKMYLLIQNPTTF